MAVSNLSAAEASALSVRILGLDHETVGLASREGLSASLRRAASFMCPTSPSRLVSAVLGAVSPVSSDGEVTRERLTDLLDLLVAAGDLLELRRDEDRSVRLLYLGPPSYIEREPGTYLISGVRPFGVSLVDFELAPLVEREGHTRAIRIDPVNAAERLADAGLRPIERGRWVATPATESADSLIGRITSRIDATPSSGGIEGLQVIDPRSNVRYYRGRWRAPKAADTGDFTARRPQAYGADLWCVVRLDDGVPKRMIEFPIDNSVVPGRDEAWRFQMAIDAVRGEPQRFAVEPFGSGTAVVVKFFSPIPGFAERYLQLVGLALEATGALFAYRVPTGAMPGVIELLTNMTWMKSNSLEGKP
ncbi:hypothetical protein C2138_07730 [Salinibacterium hongtaonis]|nr:hypothetical protein C2138_07730 [Salinibacterium hongtaonis]